MSWPDTSVVVTAPAGAPGSAPITVLAGAEVCVTSVAVTYDAP